MGRGELAPYRQGHLDGLCGLYSIVNAVRFALRSVDRRYCTSHLRRQLSRNEAELLFTALLHSLVSSRRHARLIVDGIDSIQLAELLGIAGKWLQTQKDLELSCSRPLLRRARVGTKTLLGSVEQHLLRPGTAAIVGTNAPYWSHWTVATKVTESRLYLLDSEGDTSVAVRRGERRRRYHAGLIEPARLYLLTVAPLKITALGGSPHRRARGAPSLSAPAHPGVLDFPVD